MIDGKTIPIIVCNFNRLSYLLKAIESYKKRGLNNIIILDMSSTYQPLLEWYEKNEYEVIKLANIGPRAWWSTPVFDRFKGLWYAYTDSDIELAEDCPNNILDVCIDLCERYPDVSKVGPSLVISDLFKKAPDSLLLRQIAQHEAQFYRNPQVPGEIGKHSLIDTTLAVYNPNGIGVTKPFDLSAIRLDPPYSARHLPFYIDYSNLSEEEQYYHKTCNHMASWATMAKQQGLFQAK